MKSDSGTKAENDADEREPTLSKRLDIAIANLDDVATTLAEAKEEPLLESHRKLNEAEKDIEKVTDTLESIEEEDQA
jgi:hypothetical protein